MVCMEKWEKYKILNTSIYNQSDYANANIN